jgi:glutamate/tyrosine decarboxylase-like PLP-dependent enzyme
MNNQRKEETLDPENWESIRTLGHRMLDDMITQYENVREHKFQFMPEEVITTFQQPLPLEPQGADQVYKEFQKNILPYATGNIYPTFWGFVVGTGSTLGMLADMLAHGINLYGPDILPQFWVERQVLEWIKEMLDYPSEASGVLVSGGSMANYTGLAVARNAKAKVDIKKYGLQGVPQKMTLYCSTQGHGCLIRSVELLGLGNKALRWIPTNENYQIDIEALELAIAEDREQGYHPFCIIGNAGSVNTGAFDDFNTLAEICQQEDMWFHIDGAFGAWAKLSKTHRHLTSGMERADSLAIDLHKWMYMPYEIGCALVRDKEAHSETFIYEAEYLESISNRYSPQNLSIQLSRYFRPLKAWMLLKADGVQKYSRLIQQNIDQAFYLEELVEKAPELELITPVTLNIVCFRYAANGLNEDELKELNHKIMMQLWARGLIPSDTTLNGKYTLRVCIVNHRTRRDDLEYMINEVIRLGNELVPTTQ